MKNSLDVPQIPQEATKKNNVMESNHLKIKNF